MKEPEKLIGTLQKLRALGSQVLIDDFGTGYSSLSYLNRLPVDILKIDRAFVRDLGREGAESPIIHAVIEMARRLKLKTVAEGVETAARAATHGNDGAARRQRIAAICRTRRHAHAVRESHGMTPSPHDSLTTDEAAAASALRLLFWLRVVAVVSQAAVVAFVDFGLGVGLPLRELGITIGALALWNALNYRAAHADRPIGYPEVVLNLTVDIAAFTSVIYFTGGPTNPFVSLYLVPICLAAISLPTGYAWFVAALCGAGYSLLWWHSVPLPSVHERFGGDFDLHLSGMWVNFLVAGALMLLFVGRMARLVRRRDRELAALREAALRDQQIVDLGTLAAGTAHELNTPLSTLAILVEELDETTADPAQKARLRVMQEEIAVIAERLNRIASGVGAARSAGARHASLDGFARDLLARWSELHPEIELAATFDLADGGTEIAAEATIEQAIRNVLDNAAHATLANGGRRVAVAVACRGRTLEIAVSDDGAGLDPAVRDEIGLKIVSTKQQGLGIGLLLSRAALQRFGGGLELASRPAGGVDARIRLPLDELLADAR